MGFFSDIVGAVAGPLIGGIIGGDASRDAADAQAGASREAIEEQRRTTNMLLRMLDPSRQLGYGAQGDLASLYGYSLPGFQNANALIGGQGGAQSPGLPGAPGAFGGMWGQLQDRIGAAGAGARAPGPMTGGDPSLAGRSAGAPSMARFFDSPDYNFRRDEGMRGIEQTGAARGAGFSGNTLRGLNEFNSNLAAGEFGNYFNRLMAMAGMGQAATTQAGSAVQTGANNIGGLMQNAGDARASGIMGGANALLGGLGGALYGLGRLPPGTFSGLFGGGAAGNALASRGIGPY